MFGPRTTDMAVSGLRGNERSIHFLLRQYKITLAFWVAQELQSQLGADSAARWQSLFRNAGSAAQSYYLYSQYALGSAGLSQRVERLLRAEPSEFQSSVVLRDSFMPWWTMAYFEEDPSLLVGQFGLDASNARAAHNAVLRAHDLLNAAWPSASAQAKDTIERMVFYDGRQIGLTGSTPRAYGAVYMTKHNLQAIRLACTLVHETAHHILHVMRSLGPFYSQLDTLPCYSPFRKETRPLLGVVHSGYALARMVAFLSKAMPLIRARHRHFAARTLARYADCIGDTLRQLSEVTWTGLGEGVYTYIALHSHKGTP